MFQRRMRRLLYCCLGIQPKILQTQPAPHLSETTWLTKSASLSKHSLSDWKCPQLIKLRAFPIQVYAASSAALVSDPTIPSAASPFACWKAIMNMIDLRPGNVSFDFRSILPQVFDNLFSAIIGAPGQNHLSKQAFPLFDGMHRFRLQASSLPSCAHLIFICVYCGSAPGHQPRTPSLLPLPFGCLY